jgi:hypothetical protein
MAKKLDRSRDFGTIVGDDQGRRFEQDGVFFLGDGSEWTDPAGVKKDKPAPAKAKAAPVAAPVSPAVDDQLTAQLQD